MRCGVVPTRFHIAAKDLRGDAATYAKRFDLLEVHTPSQADLARAPSKATLRKWRRSVPPHFEFVVVAGPAVNRLKRTADLTADLAHTLALVEILQARCVLLRTPPDVTPAGLWRDRMAKVLADLPTDATQVVWEPSGLWELEDAAAQAKKWSVTLATDPSRDAVPPGPVSYSRLRAMGEVRSFGPSALGRVIEAIGPRRDAYVVIETTSALAECKELRKLAASAPRAAAGGMGRVLHPRSAGARPHAEEE